jgi:hypothetical protein
MAVTNSYADGDDVQAHINQLGGTTLTLGAGSTPTLGEVEGWLDQLAAEVDSVLKSNGYSVPATGANDVLLIGRYVSQKGAAMAYHGGYMFDDTPEKVSIWEDEWTAFLDRLINKQMVLLDQSASRTRVGTIQAKVYRGD